MNYCEGSCCPEPEPEKRESIIRLSADLSSCCVSNAKVNYTVKSDKGFNKTGTLTPDDTSGAGTDITVPIGANYTITGSVSDYTCIQNGCTFSWKEFDPDKINIPMLNAKDSYNSDAVFGCSGCGDDTPATNNCAIEVTGETDAHAAKATVTLKQGSTTVKTDTLQAGWSQDNSLVFSGLTCGKSYNLQVGNCSVDRETDPSWYVWDAADGCYIEPTNIASLQGTKNAIVYFNESSTTPEPEPEQVTLTVTYSDPIDFVSIAEGNNWRDCQSSPCTRTVDSGTFIQLGGYGTGSSYNLTSFEWYDSRTNRLLFTGDPYQFTITKDTYISVEPTQGGSEEQRESTCNFNYDISATGTTPNLKGTVTYNMQCSGNGVFNNTKIYVDFANKSGFVVVDLSGKAGSNLGLNRTIKSDNIHVTGDIGSLDSQVRVYASGSQADWVHINRVDEATIK